jgi:hypothetical protein
MNGEGSLSMSGDLAVKHLPKGEGAEPNQEPRTYPDFYNPPSGPNPSPKLSWWFRLKRWYKSWRLQRRIDKGIEPRGHTRIPE